MNSFLRSHRVLLSPGDAAMIVAMIAVLMMKVRRNEIIGMAVMRNRFVPTTSSMLMTAGMLLAAMRAAFTA